MMQVTLKNGKVFVFGMDSTVIRGNEEGMSFSKVGKKQVYTMSFDWDEIKEVCEVMG